MKQMIYRMLLFAVAPLSLAQQNPPDAVARAQTTSQVQLARPEQSKSGHDSSNVFDAKNAVPASPASATQPNAGKITGFDFYRDPLNADKPNLNPEDVVKKETANKPTVMEAQKRLLERRYQLQAKLDPSAKMSRGKPLAVGPTAKLAAGMTWDRLGAMRPEEIRQQDIFPTSPCLIRCRRTAARCFPKCSWICSRGWSVLTSSSTFRMHSFPNSRPRHF